MGPMTPLWVTTDDGQERLMVARRVHVTSRWAEQMYVLSAWPRSGASVGLAVMAASQCQPTKLPYPREVCQGIVLDWPRLEKLLADEVRDLFPEARILPMTAETPPRPERTMTTLPVELDPREGPAAGAHQDLAQQELAAQGQNLELLLGEPELGWTPLRMGLGLAWAAALVALAAVGLGGWKLIDLSERRIRFVSAVTHELRTPLTTLRLYLDMLTGGMVKEEETRAEYLQTLHGETDRLSRLVGNVLDFSRLENQRPKLVQERVGVAELLEQVRATWQTRCHDAQKDLVVENEVGAGAAVLTDMHLAEQILGNLVDNACKYSQGAEDARVWVRARAANGRVVLEVEDRGPGIPTRERHSIFRAFCRGRGADVTAGGVGLGLALAQRWTGLLGGRLTLCSDPKRTGACFRLELPLAAP
jgi:signal transduction histidine kinase